jgi:putative peptide-modifying radical SAM enzyme
MHYHLLLTEECNLECRYCYKKSLEEFDNQLDKKFKFDFSSPKDSRVKIQKLKEFLSKDSEPVLIFYGGEPLMQIEKIKQIMDSLDIPFRMQTNGKLLHKLPFEYLKRINKILISLDGTRERTDFNRGKGTYDSVMSNIISINEKGYSGELIARMCVSQEFPDIKEQVISLIENGFDSVHWQIDAGFYKFDFDKERFQEFTEKYNLSISKLIDYWIEEMKKGSVLKLYPFLAIAESVLKNEKTLLRCGAGYEGYAITTDGKITACPIMNCIEDFNAGDLNTHPDNLKKFSIKGKCVSCDYFDLCGGRCLYWNYAELWPEDGNELICKTIKHLIDEIKKRMPEIEKLIKNKIISIQDFEYEKYFGPEIIP